MSSSRRNTAYAQPAQSYAHSQSYAPAYSQPAGGYSAFASQAAYPGQQASAAYPGQQAYSAAGYSGAFGGRVEAVGDDDDPFRQAADANTFDVRAAPAATRSRTSPAKPAATSAAPAAATQAAAQQVAASAAPQVAASAAPQAAASAAPQAAVSAAPQAAASAAQHAVELRAKPAIDVPEALRRDPVPVAATKDVLQEYAVRQGFELPKKGTRADMIAALRQQLGAEDPAFQVAAAPARRTARAPLTATVSVDEVHRLSGILAENPGFLSREQLVLLAKYRALKNYSSLAKRDLVNLVREAYGCSPVAEAELPPKRAPPPARGGPTKAEIIAELLARGWTNPTPKRTSDIRRDELLAALEELKLADGSQQ